MLEHLLAGAISTVCFIGLMALFTFFLVVRIEWKEAKRKHRASQIRAHVNWRAN